jgi:hypothetical protein
LAFDQPGLELDRAEVRQAPARLIGDPLLS